MLTYATLIPQMLTRFPCLQDDFRRDFDEIEQTLVHVVFGLLFNPYIIAIFCEKEDSENERRRIADFLEEMAVASDAEVRAVLTATVLERLMDDPQQFALIEPYFGRQTHVLAQKTEEWLFGRQGDGFSVWQKSE